VAWLEAAGVSYRDLERDGYSLPVIELRLRYVAPARFDDELRVRTALAELRSREARFVYEVVTAEEHPRQLANGTTRHMNLRNGAVAPMPAALRALASAVAGG
jgi:acyl-CoA thioester hydrolase